MSATDLVSAAVSGSYDVSLLRFARAVRAAGVTRKTDVEALGRITWPQMYPAQQRVPNRAERRRARG